MSTRPWSRRIRRRRRPPGTTRGGYGFDPMQAYLDETREALGGVLRPGNAGSNTAEDHKLVVDRALAQIPAEYIESLEILVRADSAGATHGFVDYCREGNMRFLRRLRADRAGPHRGPP